jgi:hypothetical protein
MAIDDAGHDGTPGQLDVVVAAGGILLRQLCRLAYPDDALALRDDDALFDRRILGTVDDFAPEPISFVRLGGPPQCS